MGDSRRALRVGIIGEFDPVRETHSATNESLEHASAALTQEVSYTWVSSSDLDRTSLHDFNGVWVAPGSPYKDMARTLDAIRFARENGVPLLGTCGGFQHMALEYARNVLGLTEAQHAEYDPNASCLFISQLVCTLAGKELGLKLVRGSRAASFYGAVAATERYYCNFSINPQYVARIERGPLRISGADDQGEARIIELPEHPFYVGTLFVPQVQSTHGRPHPLVAAFVHAAAKCAGYAPLSQD
ncbi:MAG: CTP synthase [Planctomycetota bacterium]